MAVADLVPIRIAVLSVADTRGLLALACALDRLGVTLGCTEGTYSTLYTQGLETELLSRYVRPLLGGRVKTLYPELHGPLAARADERAALAAAGLEPIDLVVCNLAPFELHAGRPDVTPALAAEHIDSGGVALVRAAARNCARVAVIVDPDDYPAVLAELAATGGALGAATRLRLAAKAFAVTAAHDAAVAGWLTELVARGERDDAIVRPRLAPLVSGPWRRAPLPVADRSDHGAPAALYAEPTPWAASAVADGDEPAPSLVDARLVAGPTGPLAGELVRDLDVALAVVRELHGPAAVLARDGEPVAASDPGHPAVALHHVLAFADGEQALAGAALALDAPLTEPLVRLLADSGVAAIVVPAITDDARATWPAAGPAVLVAPGRWHGDPWRGGALAPLAWRSVAGGLLVQDQDVIPIDAAHGMVVSARAPTDDERRDLALAARVARHVRAHALVVARDAATVAVVGGAPDLRRALLAAQVVAGPLLPGAVAAVSAPIDDPLDLDALAAAGVRALWQPGGTAADTAVVAAADRHDLALVMTGLPHLRR